MKDEILELVELCEDEDLPEDIQPGWNRAENYIYDHIKNLLP